MSTIKVQKCERCHGQGGRWEYGAMDNGHLDTLAHNLQDDRFYRCPDCRGSGFVPKERSE